MRLSNFPACSQHKVQLRMVTSTLLTTMRRNFHQLSGTRGHAGDRLGLQRWWNVGCAAATMWGLLRQGFLK